MQHWHALYTKSRNEKKVADALSDKGFEIFLPLVSTMRQWSDRKRKVQIPLFQSYIFIFTQYEKYYQDIITTPGVVKFVRIGKEVATIRQIQIDYIKKFLDHEAKLDVTNEALFVLQQGVEIIEGPFSGMRGKLVAHRQNNYFAIEIEQIGANLLVSLPISHIKTI
jgi:transcriptional antiterminator NusG